MTDEDNTKSRNTEATGAARTVRLSDDLIAVLRELIQLSLLTGTNIVDHMRAVRVNITDGSVVPTTEYIEAYNKQIEDLAAQAKSQAETMRETLAQDIPEA